MKEIKISIEIGSLKNCFGEFKESRKKKKFIISLSTDQNLLERIKTLYHEFTHFIFHFLRLQKKLKIELPRKIGRKDFSLDEIEETICEGVESKVQKEFCFIRRK